MADLFDDIKAGSVLKGVVPGLSVSVLAVQHHGKDVVEITFKDESGRPGSRLCYRGEESQFEVVDKGGALALDRDWRRDRSRYELAPAPGFIKNFNG